MQKFRIMAPIGADCGCRRHSRRPAPAARPRVSSTSCSMAATTVARRKPTPSIRSASTRRHRRPPRRRAPRPAARAVIARAVATDVISVQARWRDACADVPGILPGDPDQGVLRQRHRRRDGGEWRALCRQRKRAFAYRKALKADSHLQRVAIPPGSRQSISRSTPRLRPARRRRKPRTGWWRSRASGSASARRRSSRR